MIRTGMTCLALSVMAGCAAPVSLNDDRSPPVVSHSAALAPDDSPDLGKVEVIPIDLPAIENLAHTHAAPVPANPAATRLRGVLNAQGWQLCGQISPRQMQASPETRDALESFLMDHPIFFLDGWGRVAGNDIELESIERMVVEGPGCREPLNSFVWVAHGQDPFWAFAITHSGMQLRTRGGQPRTYVYAMPQTEGDQILYIGADYRLTLRRQPCTGATLADAYYAWTAELQTGQQQWRGCAWQGMQGK